MTIYVTPTGFLLLLLLLLLLLFLLLFTGFGTRLVPARAKEQFLDKDSDLVTHVRHRGGKVCTKDRPSVRPSGRFQLYAHFLKQTAYFLSFPFFSIVSFRL